MRLFDSGSYTGLSRIKFAGGPGLGNRRIVPADAGTRLAFTLYQVLYELPSEDVPWAPEWTSSMPD